MLGNIGFIWELYRDNGKENGNYRDYREYIVGVCVFGFKAWGKSFRLILQIIGVLIMSAVLAAYLRFFWLQASGCRVWLSIRLLGSAPQAQEGLKWGSLQALGALGLHGDSTCILGSH